MRLVMQRFSLHHIFTTLAGVPLLIALFMAIELSLVKSAIVDQAYKDKETIELTLLYDNLAHNLTVERGLTAGVLGSKGAQEQVANLRAQRTKADQHIAAFNHIEQSKASEAVGQDIDVLTEIAQNTSQLADTMNDIVSSYREEVSAVNDQLLKFKLV
ncbi:nitrate- and nitrite sensing domain-containing protein [Vibrio bivalvicida]|uniref:Nitrate- and nitrite sensing domain-containing protein n=1 Tax=Vibrio bivalvicida TaxID=1276888 RepID=A0ABV4MEB5_9VIBR